MNKSKIEWCDYTINPVKGLCPMACSYCYARRMYKRFKRNPEVEWYPKVFRGLDKLGVGSRVFVGSTMELFGEWVKEKWLNLIFEEVALHPGLTFIFLTKQPQNLPKEFPDNCWVGVSTPNASDAIRANKHMSLINAEVKFLSIEPMFDWSLFISTIEGIITYYDWLIIGAQTPYSSKTAPKLSWVQEILVAASNAGNIPVFMKNNLQPVIDHDSLWTGWKLRQEFPNP